MQTILNVKTLNLRKQIFSQKSESTSFVKINLHKMQFIGKVILLILLVVLKAITVDYNQHFRYQYIGYDFNPIQDKGVGRGG